MKLRLNKIVLEILGLTIMFIGLYFCFLKFGHQLIFEYKYIINGQRAMATIYTKEEVKGQYEYYFSVPNSNSYGLRNFNKLLTKNYEIGTKVLIRFVGKKENEISFGKFYAGIFILYNLIFLIILIGIIIQVKNIYKFWHPNFVNLEAL